jgi:hypothetical protein
MNRVNQAPAAAKPLPEHGDEACRPGFFAADRRATRQIRYFGGRLRYGGRCGAPPRTPRASRLPLAPFRAAVEVWANARD